MNSKSATLIIVDDDGDLRDTLIEYLSEEEFIVSGVPTGQELWEHLHNNRVDCVIVDGRLPDTDGVQLAQRLKSTYDVGIIIVSGRNTVEDKVLGLELGADDYLQKPFSNRELLARIRSVLRRRQRQLNPPSGSQVPLEAPVTPQPAPQKSNFETQRSAQTSPLWRLDPRKRHLISPRGETIALSADHFELLMVFTKRPLQIISRAEITQAWKGREQNGDERTLDASIQRLKKKLAEHNEDLFIQTLRAKGMMCSVTIEVK